MNFNIEKGIVPVKLGDKVQEKYGVLPLAQMIIGDSILIPFDFAQGKHIANYVSVYGKKNNVKFITRKEITGTRVFKIENK